MHEVFPMAFAQNEIDEYERRRRAREESELSFTRRLLEVMGLWRRCENRACRRLRACSDPRLCATRYADAILEWKRTVLAPHLRTRYPSVSWGAPAAVVEPQIEAALAAERPRKSTEE
jgi:hypothetical protein